LGTFAMTTASHTQNRVHSSSDQILFSTDVEGRIKLVNAAGAKLTGYSCEELQALDVFDLLPEASRLIVVRYARQALRRRFGRVFQIAIITRSGRQVVLETSLAIVRQSDRAVEFRGVAVEVRDVRKPPRCLDLEFWPREAVRRCVLEHDWVSVNTIRRAATTPDLTISSDLSSLRRE
jgi:PAS domain S-box-containing protein